VLNRFLQRLLDVALRVFSLVCRRKLGMSLWKKATTVGAAEFGDRCR
jgi:hypothetical protein